MLLQEILILTGLNYCTPFHTYWAGFAMTDSAQPIPLVIATGILHGPEAKFSEIGTTQRDKGSYVFVIGLCM